MQRYSGNLVVVAVVLAMLAGFLDAIAFSLLGFFASFMSGNSTRLGVAIANGQTVDSATAAALLLAFIAGVIVAAVAARMGGMRSRAAVLALVTALLTLAAALSGIAPTALDLLLVAAAMGAMNGVFTASGEVTVGVTYMTGSLVKLGQRLAAALMGEGGRWDWVPYLYLWSGFVAGAVLGAGAYARIGLIALWVAAAAAGAVTIWVGTMRAEAGAA